MYAVVLFSPSVVLAILPAGVYSYLVTVPSGLVIASILPTGSLMIDVSPPSSSIRVDSLFKAS